MRHKADVSQEGPPNIGLGPLFGFPQPERGYIDHKLIHFDHFLSACLAFYQGGSFLFRLLAGSGQCPADRMAICEVYLLISESKAKTTQLTDVQDSGKTRTTQVGDVSNRSEDTRRPVSLQKRRMQSATQAQKFFKMHPAPSNLS